jgi:hypothetical protein
MSDAVAHAVLFFSKTKSDVDVNPTAAAAAAHGKSAEAALHADSDRPHK